VLSKFSCIDTFSYTYDGPSYHALIERCLFNSPNFNSPNSNYRVRLGLGIGLGIGLGLGLGIAFGELKRNR